MKKHDIKYIIKKVIIGVLIVLIVGSINKCNVKAETLTSVNFNVSAHGSGSCPFWYQINNSCGIASTLYTETNTFGTYPVDFKVYSESSLSYPNSYYAKFKIVNSVNSKTTFANFVFFNTTNQDLVLDSVNLTPTIHQGTGQIIGFTVNSVSHLRGDNDNLVSSTTDWKYYLYIYSNSEIDQNSFISSYFLNNLQTISVDTTSPTTETILYLYHGSQNSLSNNIFPNDDFFTSWQLYDTNIFEFQYKSDTVSHRNDITFWWEQGLDDEVSTKNIFNSIVASTPDNWILDDYVGFISIPFNFLTGITTSTCSSISLPLPFTNETITLPCIRATLSDKVPTITTIIFAIVNGLIAYRVTMRNIDTITDIINSDDDKLEVVDL